MDNLVISALLDTLKHHTELCIEQIPWDLAGKPTMVDDLKKGLLKQQQAIQSGEIKTVKEYKEFLEKHFPLRFVSPDVLGIELPEGMLAVTNPKFQKE